MLAERGRVPFAILAALVLMLVSPRSAWAHAVGVSNGDYQTAGSVVHAEVTFAHTELVNAGLDAAAVAQEITATGDGVACPGVLGATNPTGQDGLVIHVDYTCPVAPTKVEIDLHLLFAELSHGHRHLARGGNVDDVLYRDHAAFGFGATAVADARGPVDSNASTAAAATSTSFVSFLRMGIEHILSGYDHLLFLFGLILVGGRARSILALVTSFTVAHSISLALAVLNVWAPSARFVEPAIALSIAYVGVENFFVRDAAKRWRLTFLFGLVHGFGFAGALREIQIPHAKVPVALVAFNLGVEAGQLAVLAVLLPLVLWARKRPEFRGHGVQIASACVTLAGLVWFVQRIV